MSPERRAHRLVERAASLGVPLAAADAGRLLAFLDAMLGRNRQLNLTGIRDPEQADVLHALDALALGRAKLAIRRAADLGSGNGFPGVAVPILHPAADVVLLERTGKKARALRELIEACALPRTSVLHVDAAQAPTLHPALRSRFDLVTARAVATPREIAAMAAPLTARRGHLVLWLDRDADAGLGPRTAFELEELLSYELPEPAARTRRLAVYSRREGR